MDFKNMTESELRGFLTLTEALADRASFAPSGSLTSFGEKDDANDAEREQWISESKAAAQAYVDSRRDGRRTRSYAQDTELQKEGVQSALDWLARKRKSVVRK
jgi:hypothetical protein